jgi:hypothetical protein
MFSANSTVHFLLWRNFMLMHVWSLFQAIRFDSHRTLGLHILPLASLIWAQELSDFGFAFLRNVGSCKQDPHGATTQKTNFFSVTATKISNFANFALWLCIFYFYVTRMLAKWRVLTKSIVRRPYNYYPSQRPHIQRHELPSLVETLGLCVWIPLFCATHPLSVTTKWKQTPWPESASELYRPSDRHFSAMLVPRGQRDESQRPHSRFSKP